MSSPELVVHSKIKGGGVLFRTGFDYLKLSYGACMKSSPEKCMVRGSIIIAMGHMPLSTAFFATIYLIRVLGLQHSPRPHH